MMLSMERPRMSAGRSAAEPIISTNFLWLEHSVSLRKRSSRRRSVSFVGKLTIISVPVHDNRAGRLRGRCRRPDVCEEYALQPIRPIGESVMGNLRDPFLGRGTCRRAARRYRGGREHYRGQQRRLGRGGLPLGLLQAWGGAKTGNAVVDDSFNQGGGELAARSAPGVETKNLTGTSSASPAISREGDRLRGRPARARSTGRRFFRSQGTSRNRQRFPAECGVPNNFVSGGHGLRQRRDLGRQRAFQDLGRFPGASRNGRASAANCYRAEQTTEIALVADGVAPQDAMKVLRAAPGSD